MNIVGLFICFAPNLTISHSVHQPTIFKKAVDMEKHQPTVSPATHSMFGMVNHQYASPLPFFNSTQEMVYASTIQGGERISPRPLLHSIDDSSNSSRACYYKILGAINAALLICEEDDFDETELMQADVRLVEPGQ